jgi:hypothetical protein
VTVAVGVGVHERDVSAVDILRPCRVLELACFLGRKPKKR